MRNKGPSEIITKQNYPEFFEILEEKLDGIRIPTIKIKKDWIISSAKAYSSAYSVCFNEKLWDMLNLEERVAVTLHKVYHLNSPSERIYKILSFFVVAVVVVIKVADIFFLTLPSMCQVMCWVIFFIIFRTFFMWIISHISIKHEIQADRFTVQSIDKKHFISAINKMEKIKQPFLNYLAYFLLIWPFNTHPSNKERIARLLREDYAAEK